MFEVDHFTLILMTVLLNLAMGISMILVPAAHPEQLENTRRWGNALLLQALGWLLFGPLRPVLGLPLSVALGNGMLLLSNILLISVIGNFTGRRLHLTRWYLLCGTAVVLLTALATKSGTLQWRIVIASLTVAALMYYTARLLWPWQRQLTVSERVTGGIFLMLALFMLLRAGLHWSIGIGMLGDVPDEHAINSLAYVVLHLIGMLLTFGYLLMCHERDMNAQLLAQRKIQHIASHDSLTGLANRQLFNELLAEAISRARANRQPLAVLFIDLNQFKPVNDRFGHAIGDRVLQVVAERLRAGLRSDDVVARLGGDEFVALLPSLADSEVAHRVATQLTKRLEQPIRIEGHELRIGASIGTACYPEDGDTPGALLQRADQKMYQFKAATHSRLSQSEAH